MRSLYSIKIFIQTVALVYQGKFALANLFYEFANKTKSLLVYNIMARRKNEQIYNYRSNRTYR